MCKFWLSVALLGAACSLATAQIVVDGSADDVMYGNPLIVQDTETNFGNSDIGRPDFANGSELDAAWGFIYNGNLHLALSGNLQTNGNKLEIFIDSRAGGQNKLLFENPGPDNQNLRRMSASTAANEDGLQFAAGFTADFWVSVAAFGDPVGVFVDYAELYVDPNNPGVAYYAGSGSPVCTTDNGELTGGDVGAPVVNATINNVNTAGVIGGISFHFDPDPALVKTGVELIIPLSAIGSPAGSVKVTAFVNGQQHDFVSNQLLGGLFGGENFGEPRNANFGTTAHQPFTVAVLTAPRGACCNTANQTCSITTQAGCTGANRMWLGANTNCDSNPCDSTPGGRCCVDDNIAGACFFRTQAECNTLGGVWTPNETCAGCPCLLPPKGACCTGTDCTVTDEVSCLNSGGDYLGNFTNCNDTPCATGGCCTELNCAVVRQFECEFPSNYLGDGTNCDGDPCAEPTIAAPYIAGGVINGWCNNCTLMTETAPGSGIWQYTVTGLTADERFEFKITNGTWDITVPSGPNSWAVADANGEVTITYDGNFYQDGWLPQRDRLGLDVQPPTGWGIPGNYLTEIGAPGNWNNAEPLTLMALQGDGTHLKEYTGVTPGTYEFKFTKFQSWDSLNFDTRSVATANWTFTVAAETDTVRLRLDNTLGRVQQEVIPAGPALCPGDMNCDGTRNFSDIDPFVLALQGQAAYEAVFPNCNWLNGDVNGDNTVNFSDIDAFVGLLGAGACP